MIGSLLLTAWIGCQLGDGLTTAYGLHHGFHEAGLSGRHVYSLKVSVNVGLLIWQQRSLRHKTGAARWVLPVAMAGTGCGAATWNLHQLAN